VRKILINLAEKVRKHSSHAIAVRASACRRVGAASSSAAASNGGSRAPPPAYYSDPFVPCNLLDPAVANALLTAYA